MDTQPSSKVLEIPLAGYIIPVYLVPELHEKHGADGLFSPNDRAIYLDADLSAGERKEVLLHEIIEAVNYLCDWRLKHHIIQTMAVFLHQALSVLLLDVPSELQ